MNQKTNTNESKENTNESDASTNESKMITNESKIVTNEPDVDMNESKVDINEPYVGMNESDASTNEPDVNMNEAKNILPEKYVEFSDHEVNIGELIGQNKVKITVKYVPCQDVIDEIIAKIKKQTGKTPSHCIIAMRSDGAPIFALDIDGEIASDIGYSVHCKSSDGGIEQYMTLVNLNTLTSK
jgi:hypothetical protein